METLGETHVGLCGERERSRSFSLFSFFLFSLSLPSRTLSPGFPSERFSDRPLSLPPPPPLSLSFLSFDHRAAGISPRLWIKAPNEAANGLPRVTGRLPSRYRGHNIKSPLWRFVSGHWCHIGINFTLLDTLIHPPSLSLFRSRDWYISWAMVWLETIVFDWSFFFFFILYDSSCYHWWIWFG